MPVLTTLPLLLRKRKQSNSANSHCVEYFFCSRLYLHRGKKTTTILTNSIKGRKPYSVCANTETKQTK